MKKNILICNGSLGAEHGNTQVLLDKCSEHLQAFDLNVEIIHLKDLLEKKLTKDEVKNKLNSADGFVFTSGTYWDSWGSPMQYFLETATEFEGSKIFFGKPAAVIISMHSVGGKSVLSRLQGVLNTLGLLIPPMSGMVYSLTSHLALQSTSSFAEDFWSLEDIEVLAHNLNAGLGIKENFMTWPVDHKDPKRIWIK